MVFNSGSFYHIYNRGNDKQRIFFQERNYKFFLEKVNKYICGCADVLAWCLMPNHFHLLVRCTGESVLIVKDKPVEVNALTEGIRLMLSSYTKAVQKQEKLTGNLFQQKTKSKCVDDYATVAFHYIHQNPFRAKLTTKLDGWMWSSIHEYLGRAFTGLCNQACARQDLEVNFDRFLEEAMMSIPDQFVTRLLQGTA